MTSSKKMRLFNGHLKMDSASLKKIFLMQLSNIYSIKIYLVANLPLMAITASFADLKNAILENADDIKLQILRMDCIYELIGETYHPHQCFGVRALTIEAFSASKQPGMSRLETDLTMLYHLNAMESIEVACFTILQDLAAAMHQDDMKILLQQNLDLAKDCRELYQMIAKEYVN